MPQEYRRVIVSNPLCIVLIITPDSTQMNMIHIMHGILGDYYRCVIPVRDEDAHHVSALRVPRIRVFKNSEIVHDIILDMHNSTSIITRLREVGLMK